MKWKYSSWNSSDGFAFRKSLVWLIARWYIDPHFQNPKNAVTVNGERSNDVVTSLEEMDLGGMLFLIERCHMSNFRNYRFTARKLSFNIYFPSSRDQRKIGQFWIDAWRLRSFDWTLLENYSRGYLKLHTVDDLSIERFFHGTDANLFHKVVVENLHINAWLLTTFHWCLL